MSPAHRIVGAATLALGCGGALATGSILERI